jgi:phosphotransferase system enzyme I (PtsI)
VDCKTGVAVSPGVAIGPALVLESQGYDLPQRHIPEDQADDEVRRVRQALEQAVREVRQTQEAVTSRLGAQCGAIFAAHAQLLADPYLERQVATLIREHHLAAESAVSEVLRRYAQALQGVGSVTLAGRVLDIFDVEKVLLENLLGQRRERLRHLEHPVIVLAHDLTPAETAKLPPSRVHAFATEAGGRTSHTAIVAGMLGIPAVVGAGPFLARASDEDIVIVDGNEGVIILRPDPDTLGRYEKAARGFTAWQSQLGQLRALPARTRDDRACVALYGNIEFPHETEHCLERGAEGVGLYRTEFLYLDRQSHPTEEEHFQAYLSVVEAMSKGAQGREKPPHSLPVVIRTLDLGADKFAPLTAPGDKEGGGWAGHGHLERNPFLGLRSVRLCLRNLALFKTQLRAILRASAFGDVRILFPMISTLLELRQCKMLLAEVKEDLQDEGLAFNPRLPVGTMVEVPSAAILADQLAREVDFFSIGTNDLIQYTLAADRNNETVASLYDAGDPAVLRLIEQVVRAAQAHDVGVNVCGEMSGDPLYTLFLIGLGLRQLSLTPHNIPEIKKVVRSATLSEAEAITQEALRLETARDVNNYLREQTRRICPEAVG